MPQEPPQEAREQPQEAPEPTYGGIPVTEALRRFDEAWGPDADEDDEPPRARPRLAVGLNPLSASIYAYSRVLLPDEDDEPRQARERSPPAS